MNNQTSRFLSFDYDNTGNTKVTGEIKFRIGGGIEIERLQILTRIGGLLEDVTRSFSEYYPNKFHKFFHAQATELLAKEKAAESLPFDHEREEFEAGAV